MFIVLKDESAVGAPVVLEEHGAFHALADPLRIQIMKLLSTPASARELAAAVDRPVTSLYHHLDLLEQHGLIAVHDIHKDGRALVRRYKRSTTRFELGAELASLEEIAGALDSAGSKREGQLAKRIAIAVRRALDDERRTEKRLRMHVRGQIDPDRLDELGERLQEVLSEFLRAEHGETFEVAITVASATSGEDRR